MYIITLSLLDHRVLRLVHTNNIKMLYSHYNSFYYNNYKNTSITKKNISHNDIFLKEYLKKYICK